MTTRAAAGRQPAAARAHGGTTRHPAARPASGARATVSSTSAARFAARARRRRLQRAGILTAALAGGLGIGWLVFASPVLTVRDVEVRGVFRLPVTEVQAAAAGQLGRSMALASPQAVAERIVELPLVRAAHVHRAWPSTLVVTVSEREPIAGVPDGARVALVDRDGVVVERVLRARVPAAIPVVEVDVQRAGADALRAARAVADQIPPAYRRGLRTVRASSPDDVSVVLADGSTVVWGSAQDGDRKAAALMAVHPRPGKHRVVIDVSAPGAPAVTGRR